MPRAKLVGCSNLTLGKREEKSAEARLYSRLIGSLDFYEGDRRKGCSKLRPTGNVDRRGEGKGVEAGRFDDDPGSGQLFKQDL